MDMHKDLLECPICAARNARNILWQRKETPNPEVRRTEGGFYYVICPRCGLRTRTSGKTDDGRAIYSWNMLFHVRIDK